MQVLQFKRTINKGNFKFKSNEELKEEKLKKEEEQKENNKRVLREYKIKG